MTSAPRPSRIAPEDKESLRAFLRAQHVSERARQRARALLLLGDDRPAVEVAATVGMSRAAVYAILRRYQERGLAVLQDRKRSGRPPSLDAAQVRQVMDLTLHQSPPGGKRWSTRRLAEVTGLSHSTIHRIWSEYRVDPRSPKADASSEPVNDVLPPIHRLLAVYLDPPDPVLVIQTRPRPNPTRVPKVLRLCLEDMHKQLFALPQMQPGSLQARDIVGFHTEAREARHRKFLDFLHRIDCATASLSGAIQIVMDSPAYLRQSGVRSWFESHKRFRTHVVSSKEQWLSALGQWLAWRWLQSAHSLHQLQRATPADLLDLHTRFKSFVRSYSTSVSTFPNPVPPHTHSDRTFSWLHAGVETLQAFGNES